MQECRQTHLKDPLLWLVGSVASTRPGAVCKELSPMAQEKIKDWTGRVIGYTEQRGSRLWLHDWQGKMLGYYDSSTGKTYDWQGKIIGQGNTLMMLLK
jgi:hypothetical protein